MLFILFCFIIPAKIVEVNNCYINPSIKQEQIIVLKKANDDTITITEIYKKAHRLLEYMNKHNKDSFSLCVTGEIIKVYNTFSYVLVSNRDSIFVKKYFKKFINDYYPIVEAKLQMTDGLGSTLYSKALNMYIGFSMDMERKDFYIFWKNDSEGRMQVLE